MISVVLELKNQNAEPLNLYMASGKIKQKLKENSKTNENIKNKLYTWIAPPTRVVKSPIYNDFIKVILDDQIEPQMVPRLLLQV